MKDIEIGLKEIQEIETRMVFEITRICEFHNIPIVLTGGSAIGAVRHHGNIPWDDDVDMCVPIKFINKTIDVLSRELPPFFELIYYPKNKDYSLLFPRVVLRGAYHFTLHVDIFPIIGAPLEKTEQEKFWNTLRKTTLLFSRKQLHGYPWEGAIKRVLRLIVSYLIIKRPRTIATEFDRLCNLYDYDTCKYVVNPCGKYGLKEIVPKEFLEGVQKVDYNMGYSFIPKNYSKYLSFIYGDYMKLPNEYEQHHNDNYKETIPYDSYIRFHDFNSLM